MVFPRLAIEPPAQVVRDAFGDNEVDVTVEVDQGFDLGPDLGIHDVGALLGEDLHLNGRAGVLPSWRTEKWRRLWNGILIL